DAGEVADAVVVLRVAETAGQHQTRFAGVASRFLSAHRLNPGDHESALISARLLSGLRRRHLPCRKLIEDELPVREIFDDRRSVRVGPQIKPCQFRLAVATDTVLVQEGPNIAPEDAIKLAR